MNRLTTNFLGINLKNPILAASGTFGFGREYNEFYNVGELGGICTKGLTLHPKAGNNGLRIHETPAGLMNSIGLQNPGVDSFISDELEHMQQYGCATIVNLGGSCEDDYLEAVRKLNHVEFDILELNISCPNVKSGGMAFGIKASDVFDITDKVKRICKQPLMVKLSPNAENITDSAIAAEDAGADAVSLINTIQAMAIDIKRKRPVFENIYAGLSGPAVKPIALRMVHQVSKKVSIPVCGIGGILTYTDVLEFIMAGATVVQIGSGLFRNLYTPIEIINDLNNYCEKESITNIQQIRNII